MKYQTILFKSIVNMRTIPFNSPTWNVVYWPPTRPGCQYRKCTCVNNRCIWSRNTRILYPWPWTGWMSEKLLRSQEEEWTSNYYITWVKTGSQSVGDHMSWRSDAVEKTSTQRGWAPKPPVEQPRRTGKKRRCGHKSGGQNVAVLFSLQLPLTHNPFNKVRGIFF